MQEYKLPKKIGDTVTPINLENTGEAIENNSPVEEQLISVLGYVQTIWKNSPFIKSHDKDSFQTGSMRLSQNGDDENLSQKHSETKERPVSSNQIEINKDLVGVDLTAKAPRVSLNAVMPSAKSGDDTPKMMNEPIKFSKEEQKKITKNESKTIKNEETKESKRKKIIEEIMNKMPNFDYLIKHDLEKTETNKQLIDT